MLLTWKPGFLQSAAVFLQCSCKGVFMKKNFLYLLIITVLVGLASAFTGAGGSELYKGYYQQQCRSFAEIQDALREKVSGADFTDSNALLDIREQIHQARMALKRVDFWLRYLEPVSYKLINGPLPVEWETEVFEKFEQPYKRTGGGLFLAEEYLGEETVNKDSLLGLLNTGIRAIEVFNADSVTGRIGNHDHFYLCNRLFLLNLAAIYTTGFECPDTSRILPELKELLMSVREHYQVFNKSFPAYALPENYLELFERTSRFVNAQGDVFGNFDHFTFIRDYVNPLFVLNQQLIRSHKVRSGSYTDYSLNKDAKSLFDKQLYFAQEEKGIFRRVTDSKVLEQLRNMGRLLFYDPILSGNNSRSCASCHKPTQFFSDTTGNNLQFDRNTTLARNTPSLVNAGFNHLLMNDGKFISLQDQVRGVITNPQEMGASEEAVVRKVLSCKTYKDGFTSLVRETPWTATISLDHIAAAITYYYSRFSYSISNFDSAMNRLGPIEPEVVRGFNLFMGKAQCGTCHFVPQFNGVKPPYTGSEFEVLGTPADRDYIRLSPDNGRYIVHPVREMEHAFRTGSLRNIAHTAPYMHNGVFRNLEEVIDFYDTGGGAGKGLTVANQTLSTDSLKLTPAEKRDLIRFLHSLSEPLDPGPPPVSLPVSGIAEYNKRKPGGLY